MDSLFPKNTVVYCGCGSGVSLYRDYKGKMNEFKCAKCLPHLNFSSSPRKGFYTNCQVCRFQHRCNDPLYNICHICISSKIQTEPFDLKTPQPSQKPSNCGKCDDANCDVFWDICPYQRDVHNEILYTWFCNNSYQRTSCDI